MSNTKSFAAYYRNDNIREASSSGGVFYAIAERVLNDNGIVFGAVFDDKWIVHHGSCSNIQDLCDLMQSKYVQSSLGKTFVDVKNLLQEEKKILFCGTPCQVEGLISYLNNTLADDTWKESLITIDFICHGVPSRKVWRRYLEEKTGKKGIKSINFRDKSSGWRNFSLRIDFDDGSSYLQTQQNDLYMRGFLNNLYLRESCYECQFRGVNRISDFTIADFWGVQSFLPEFYDDKGTSIVMVHNDKSAHLLEELSDKLKLCEISNDIVIQTNTPIVKSVNRNSKRDAFFADCDEKSISENISYYLRRPMLTRIKRIVWKIIHS